MHGKCIGIGNGIQGMVTVEFSVTVRENMSHSAPAFALFS
jgi:hypothetical protein